MGTSTDKFKKEFYQRRWAKRGPFFSYSELIESARAFEFAASAVMNGVLREYKYKLKLLFKHVLPAKVRAINSLKNTNHKIKEEAGMGRRRADEKFLNVNEIKNATTIIRRS